MSEKYIRASDIPDYVYCRRSWWLSRVAGYASQNVAAFSRGTAYHQAHGHLVQRAIWARRIAVAIFFVAVAVSVFVLLGGV
jgi:hypothetical protein